MSLGDIGAVQAANAIELRERTVVIVWRVGQEFSSACSPRDLVSTRNRMRLILPNLSRRYAAGIAVKVLPVPVAICTSALGRFSAKEVSRFWIAVNWHVRNPVVPKAGKCFM